ncbi:MAG: hypothetical protein ACK5O2_13550 [Microthrixaceae bacterium]
MRADTEPSSWRLLGWWAGSVAAALVHNGLWATPNLAFVSLIASNPGTNPFGGALAGDYMLTDVSLTSLAWLVGQSAPHEIARLHLVVLVLGWAAVVYLAYRRFGYRAARALTVLIAASPAVTVSMQFLGQPDPLTAMCGIAMVLARRWWAVVALGVIAGLTHPEQAVFMAAAAGTLRTFLPPHLPPNPRSPNPRSVVRDEPVELAAHHRTDGSLRRAGVGVAAAVGGVLIGRVLTQIWFWVNDIVISTPRTRYLELGLSSFVEHHTQQPVALLWSLWGPLWLVLAALLGAVVLQRSGRALTVVDNVPSGVRTAGLVASTVALLALVPVVVTLDETRVYAVITAPLLAAGALWIAAVLRERVAVWGAGGLLVLTALLPGVMATGITTWRSQFDTPAMATFVLGGTVPDRLELTPWLLEPFDFVIPDPPS